MRHVIAGVFFAVLPMLAASAFAQNQGQSVASAEASQVQAQPPVASTIISPATAAPATEMKQGSATFGGSGLLLNTNSMLGIHPRQ